MPRGGNVVESSENEKQNTEDIKQIQKEQVIIKDQLAAVTNALQNFGEQMRGMRTSVENLRYERVDCPGTANPMYGHRFKGIYNSDNTKNQYIKRYEDPRLYNPGRSNDGQLQGNCFNCGRKGHYATACRFPKYNKSSSSQVVQQQNLDQHSQDIRSNITHTSAVDNKIHSTERNEQSKQLVSFLLKTRFIQVWKITEEDNNSIQLTS